MGKIVGFCCKDLPGYEGYGITDNFEGEDFFELLVSLKNRDRLVIPSLQILNKHYKGKDIEKFLYYMQERNIDIELIRENITLSTLWGTKEYDENSVSVVSCFWQALHIYKF